jgi:hypothetical protein
MLNVLWNPSDFVDFFTTVIFLLAKALFFLDFICGKIAFLINQLWPSSCLWKPIEPFILDLFETFFFNKHVARVIFVIPERKWRLILPVLNRIS